eukprot:CAMPEP_0119033450 /NCGR_PEP_ID=MMETSP1177-20130426/492_1 /TAXON_ID=2985 /ORGANISM="Ochromonas sp, Strain CCMP1899" /LENGTH=491 /DNA_ID=CAMNT_0006990203 /DNA_START=161 /DNA_END=1636 /DNA_ORIENTATION=-
MKVMKAMKVRKQDDYEDLETSNILLNSTVQELRLEISYYQGEVKQLEWEKKESKKDVSKMTDLFKSWLHDLQSSSMRSVLYDSKFLSNIVRNPTRSIADIMQMNNLKILVTTCQPPFFIEFSNKTWTQECGWENHEILGLTCNLLQGDLTDAKTAAAFTRDMKEVGYGVMRINNYRKNGEIFNAEIAGFPIYDSVSSSGADSDVPVLTHFACILSDVRSVTPSDLSEIPVSISRLLKHTMVPNTPIPSSVPPLKISNSSSSLNYDRRVHSKSFKSECQLTSESFAKSATTVRISDLLRLMLSCSSAMVLTDKIGRIIHCNRQWVELTGYTLSDVEGTSCGFLQGSMTDHNEIRRCNKLNKSYLPSEMKVVNYRKDGLMFTNHVTTAPIKGGFMNDDVTHFCALLIPQANVNSSYRDQKANKLKRFHNEVLTDDESKTFNMSNMSNIFEFDCEKEEEEEKVVNKEVEKKVEINFNSVFDYISPNHSLGPPAL